MGVTFGIAANFCSKGASGTVDSEHYWRWRSVDGTWVIRLAGGIIAGGCFHAWLICGTRVGFFTQVLR